MDKFPIHIAFNFVFLRKKITGIRVHAIELFRALEEQKETKYIFHVITTKEGADILNEHGIRANGGIKVHIIASSFEKETDRLKLQLFSLNNTLKQNRIALLHCFDYLTPLQRPAYAKIIATIHDLIWLENPNTYSLPKRLFKKVFFSHSIRKADALIAVSKTSKESLIQHYGHGYDQKTKVIPNGLRNTFVTIKKQGNHERLIKGEYIIAVGRYLPHKNYERLIKAYAHCNTKAQLVIAGSDMDKSVVLQRLAQELGLNDKLLLLKNPTDAELISLISHASLFVMPSLTEGFGLPLLEAMSLSTPVLCSDIPVLKEVCENAALYFNPLRIEDMAAKITYALNSSPILQKLIENGHERVQAFSWENSAKQVMNLYDDLLLNY